MALTGARAEPTLTVDPAVDPNRKVVDPPPLSVMRPGLAWLMVTLSPRLLPLTTIKPLKNWIEQTAGVRRPSRSSTVGRKRLGIICAAPESVGSNVCDYNLRLRARQRIRPPIATGKSLSRAF